MKTYVKNIFVAAMITLVFGAALAIAVPQSVSALTIYFPTIRIGGEGIDTGNSHDRMPAAFGDIFRPRGGEEESTSTTVAETSTGGNNANGGEINTGNASTTVNVENNGPVNNETSESNNNGGVNTGDGGDGGRGDRGGSVETGVSSSMSRTFNSMNDFVLDLLPWLR